MGFLSSMPGKPSSEEVAKMKQKGKTPHTQCGGRGRRSVGGNVIPCEGCGSSGFV